MNRVRAMALEEEGRKGAARLVKMLEDPTATLNSVLLLVLVTQLTSATLLGVVLEGVAGTLGLIIGVVLLGIVLGLVAVQALSRILAFLSVALFFAVVLGPAVDFLARRAHVRRGVATVIVFLVAFSALAGRLTSAVGETLQDWAETAEHDERLQSWVRAAYNGPPPRAADGTATTPQGDGTAPRAAATTRNSVALRLRRAKIQVR